MTTAIEQFLQERNQFLSEPNPTVGFVRAFFAKWNPDVPQPQHDIACLAGFYKARLGWLHCPEPLRCDAEAWLTRHGFTLDP